MRKAQINLCHLKRKSIKPVFALSLVTIMSACTLKGTNMQYQEKQLTFDQKGHMLNHTQIFSQDGKWVVYDTRNDDTKIGATPSIEILNIETGEIREIYHTQNQTEFGPGVGAATFSPTEDRVIFIQGIRNADKNRPYDFTRRTGVAIDITNPNQAIFMDARDINAPFTPGALRGGTHAHSWSGDGQYISFTYNDYVMEQLAKTDSSVKDLRTIGVMFPKKVAVKDNGSLENNSGEMFSVLVADVVENPTDNTDQIDRAFDECWIGQDGYQKADGSKQPKAIAFQGNVRENGQVKTEVFVVDLPSDLTQFSSDRPLQGTVNKRPYTPAGVSQRRITHLTNGVQGPRHWLRTTPDGSQVIFLSKDTAGFINAFAVNINSGEVKQLTHNQFDMQSGVNVSPNGEALAYVAQNSVYVSDIKNKKTEQLTKNFSDTEKPSSAVSWSKDGKSLLYNRMVDGYIQIFRLNLQ